MLPKLLLAIILGAIFAVAGGHTACAQWVETTGPNGGAISSLVQHGSTLFAGSEQGIFRSSDSGASWTNSSTGFLQDENGQFYPVSALVLSGSTLLAGIQYPGGIFRSTNDGDTWEAAGMADTGIGSFAVRGSQLFVATDNGVFRSDDNGSKWNRTDTTVDGSGTLWPISSGLLFAPFDGNIYRSSDSGATWNLAYASSELGVTGFASIGTLVFASTKEGMLLSTDSGRSWGLARDSGSVPGISCLSSIGTTLIAGTLFGMILSNDNSTTWSHATGNGLVNTDILSLLTIGGKLLAGTNGGGVFSTMDLGANWTWNCRGLPLLSIRNMAVSGTHIVTMTPQGVFRSDDNGNTWMPANIASTPSNFQQFAVIDTNIYAAGGDIYSTSENTRNWHKASDSGLIGSAALLVSSGTNLFVGTADSGIFFSSDRGANWKRGGLRDSSVLELVASGTNLFAQVSFSYPDSITGWPVYKFEIYRSSDSGITWKNVTNELPDTATKILVVQGTKLFAALSGFGLYVSTNSGSSWKPIGYGIPLDADVHSFVVVDSNLFAGTDQGICLSTNGGSLWTNVGNGLQCTNVIALAASGSELFAGTDTGVWRRPLSEMIRLSGVPAQASIEPEMHAYPNPLTESTTISFVSATAGYADICIVNTLGAEVAHLFSGELSLGEHQFTWSDPAVPDGMYECVVRMNGRVQQAGLVVMR